MSSHPVRFVHRGRVVTVGHGHPTRTVLEWLREDARCTGTKEGCAEGDCGACTVVVGEPVAATAQRPEHLRLDAVNACIRFVPTLHGKVLFTVEDLADLAGASPAQRPGHCDPAQDTHRAPRPLHPVQQALVECHGSQCGFCTPGFVMSLWAQYEAVQAGAPVPDRAALADVLAGNLCRCTGYRPILQAGLRMFGLPPVPLDPGPYLAALRSIAEADAADAAAEAHAADADADADADAAAADAGPDRDRAPAWRAAHDRLPGAPSHVLHRPVTLAQLDALCAASPQARLLAGATDVGLWVTKQQRVLPELIHTMGVRALHDIDEDADGTLRIGAAATLERAWSALVVRHPELRELWRRFASPPVRNAGTMGGNVANGSPIGDSAPALIALGARVVLRRAGRERTLPLDAFYVDYGKNRLEPGEYLRALHVPRAGPGLRLRGYKISKRFDSDISAVCGVFALTVRDGRIDTVRLAWGGMAATVRRAAAAEAAMLGRPWTEDTLRAAQAALAGDFDPLTDMRASRDYRAQVAANLLRRFWLSTRDDAPLDAAATDVRAAAA